MRILVVAAVISACVAVAATLTTWGLNLWSTAANACVDKSIVTTMSMNAANGCLEFWINRYQSLIGNVLTAVVAGVTLLWIARQLDFTARQTAAAGAQTLLQAAEAFQAEAGDLNRLIEVASTINALAIQLPNKLRSVDFEPGHLSPVLDEIKRFGEAETARVIGRGGEFRAQRVKVAGLCGMTVGFAGYFNTTPAGPGPDTAHHQRYTVTEMDRDMSHTVWHQSFELQTAASNLLNAVNRRLDLTWKQIDGFEARAIGDEPAKI